ncbi:tetratricopeptide repeat-containing sensor histidine kinase [Reichenbachiella sp.]|uniref:tetratricopeptide repeat-containing sensor histidine kinase n=1 Tax=Reichenbachiella sp. TaxID=2184521 RepID=UPI003B5C245B
MKRSILCLSVLLVFNIYPLRIYASTPSDAIIAKADSCAQVLNFDCAIDYYQEALLFKHGDSSLTAFLKIHNQIGDIYYKQGYFTKANRSYQLVLRYAEDHHIVEETAKALMGQSHVLWRYGDNVNSIQNILRSIEFFRSARDTANLVSASNILGGIYVSTGELSKASEIYGETLEIAINGKDSVGMASSYEYKGVIRSFNKEFSEAIKYYLKSLSINQKIGNELDAGITNANIGEAYLNLSDYKIALEYLSVAEEILTRHNFNSGLIFVNYCAGECHMKLGQFSRAHKRFDKSLELIQLTGEMREQSTVLGLKAKCFELEGKFSQAYKVHKEYAIAKDSLNTSNQNKQLMQIMGQFEFEKKEQENLYLQQENALKAKEIDSKQAQIRLQYAIVISLLIFLMIVVLLFVKLYKNKKLLDEANQTKNKLFGFIAHDIKAPLGNLQMLVHMLEDGFAQNQKEQDKVLSELNNCTYSVVQLTDDLISWSVAQQDGLDFHPKNVVLGEMVKDTLELFMPQIEFKNVIIENNIQPYLQVYIDQKAFLSILRNVISNAIKFSETGGAIELSAKEIISKKTGRAMIELRCKDEGVGMSKERAELLVKTNQIQTTRGTANEKGTGLGLNLIKEFVQKSNGYIKIKSKENIGTKFSVFLPATAE